MLVLNGNVVSCFVVMIVFVVFDVTCDRVGGRSELGKVIGFLILMLISWVVVLGRYLHGASRWFVSSIGEERFCFLGV